MRKRQLVRQPQPISRPDAHSRSAPLADAVQGKNPGLVEGTGKKSAGSVTLVVICEHERSGRFRTQLTTDRARDMNPVLGPQWHRECEAAEAARCKGEVRFQEPLEFFEGLFVEDDVVDLPRGEPRLPETVGSGIRGKSSVMLPPREPLLWAAATIRPSMTNAAALS
jgi:hypothetical protein